MAFAGCLPEREAPATANRLPEGLGDSRENSLHVTSAITPDLRLNCGNMLNLFVDEKLM